MAEGIRIRHHSRRSQTVTVPMLSLPLQGPRPVCSLCAQTHLCKTVHLVVDGEGTSIITRPTWNLIQGHAPNDGGFVVVNPVAEPPDQTVVAELVDQKVTVFDLADGTNPTHTVDVETVVQNLMEAVPDATEEQVIAFLEAKVREQGPAVSGR